MSRLVLYLAAPVSAPTADGVEANLSRARRWLRWLVENTEHAVCVPWMPYVQELEESRFRDRGLRDDLAMLDRCDAIVLVGGRVSEGMGLERDRANRMGKMVASLIVLGEEPPTAELTQVAVQLLNAELA